MFAFEHIVHIAEATPSKIVFLVMDGLGGLPWEPGGLTELETARTPNLDKLVQEGVVGLSDPVAPGITPGSGPGHLGIFGYDPVKFDIGRGVLEALGIDFPLTEDDVAARGNFCTVDEQGLMADRRAGRLSTDVNARLCETLRQIRIEGVELYVEPVRDYRFVLVLRGADLSAELSETDPQRVGVPIPETRPLSPEAQRTAAIVNEFVEKARAILREERPANMLTLRGFAKLPTIPTMKEVFKLNPAAIAVYPMYRGLARLVGMEILSTGQTFGEQLDTLKAGYQDHDFFFIHFKRTDSTGEDGNFSGKVQAIEEVDGLIPRITELSPDVVVVTGDHSTPSLLKSHSWHPVPLLLHSRWCRPDEAAHFSERACLRGGLGRLRAMEIMPLALAHAMKLAKYGA